ncbi:MAG: winged helix-turn-helix domain-containing protein [Planctomycetaceae bacterium]|nr:winged helix-turn-helix domain-containing protein [Planctomycetaceae bacterium]
MKTKKSKNVEVQTGKTYRAMVRGKVSIVTVKGEVDGGGWDVEMISTGSHHRVSSISGFVCECDKSGKPIEAATGKKAPEASRAEAPTAKSAKEARPAKAKRLGGLGAAVQVLAEAGKPMNAADMIKCMLDRGLWTTGGKTPAATIYAAIIREISSKGQASRFRKTDRGLFELTPSGIQWRTEAGAL